MPTTNQYQPVLSRDKKLTILNGQQTSDIVDLSGTTVVGFIMPAVFDGTKLDLDASIDLNPSNALPMHNTAGTRLFINIGAARHIAYVPSDLASTQFIRVTSDLAQAADREITLVTRPLS